MTRAFVLLMLILPGAVSAAGVSRPSRILQQDLRNHRSVRPKPLSVPRTVNRYTSRAQAARELKGGLRPNSHMTPNSILGRPLTGPNAQSRYGLPKKPEVRERIELPKGMLLRHNRATGAARGIGEITSPKKVPPSAIKRVIPLKR
jgi:hypothetical protein